MHNAGVIDTALTTVHSDDVKVSRFSAKTLANLAEDPGNCPMSTCCCMKFEAALSAVIRHELQQTDLSEQIKSIEVEDAKVQKELDKALKHLADVQVRVMVHEC